MSKFEFSSNFHIYIFINLYSSRRCVDFIVLLTWESGTIVRQCHTTTKTSGSNRRYRFAADGVTCRFPAFEVVVYQPFGACRVPRTIWPITILLLCTLIDCQLRENPPMLSTTRSTHWCQQTDSDRDFFIVDKKLSLCRLHIYIYIYVIGHILRLSALCPLCSARTLCTNRGWTHST